MDAVPTATQPARKASGREPHQEAELPALRRELTGLGRKVEAAQSKVLATIDSKHAEFVAAFDQIGELRGSVAELQGDLQRASALLGGQGEVDGGLAPAAKLRTAVREHSELEEVLQAHEAAATTLTALLAAHRQLNEVASLTSASRFVEAAAGCSEVAKRLQAISAPDTSREPAALRRAKATYYQKRAVLASCLEESFSQICVLSQRRATARPSSGTSLQEVWQAFHLLGLRERRTEQLADLLLQMLLRPLLEAGRKLLPGMQLQASENVEADGQEVWTWAETPSEHAKEESDWVTDDLGVTEDEEQSKRLPPARAVLAAIESLFCFASEHWAANSTDVCAVLGKRLWPKLVRQLLQSFCCRGSDGEALERFELSMCRKGFIVEKEKTLSRHVQDQRGALGKQRRIAVLNEVRSWLLQQDFALKEVSDAQEPGSVTQILKLMGVRARRAKSTPSAASSAVAAAAEPISEKLQQALRDDSSLLRLPSMRVSEPAHRLGGKIRGLMDEAVTSVEQGKVEAASNLNRLVRELCALFAVLRPFAQQAHIATNPRSCGLLLTDCLYLVHVMLVLPYSYVNRLPCDLQHLVLFLDLVPQIRRLGETHFLAMLRHQQEVLAAAFKLCDFGRNFIAAETALAEAVQHAKETMEGLKETLPAQLLQEAAGQVVGILCRELLGKLFQLQRAEPEDVGNISMLLTSALVMARPIIATTGAPEETVNSVPGWRALEVTADLLGSDLSRFLEHRAALMEALSGEEVLRLLSLSLRDGDLTPEEAWSILSAS